jgi:glucans biosynthesis protein
MKNKTVCYLHRGKSPGAPRGNENALKHGFYTAEAIAERLYVRMLLKRAKDQMAELRN